jgi:hypothetical protein
MKKIIMPTAAPINSSKPAAANIPIISFSFFKVHKFIIPS